MEAAARVLLVDDEAQFAEVLAERLSRRGVCVDTAGDGAEALRLQAATDYDAVLVDLTMPGMDGLQTLTALLAQDADLQVILLTGHGSLQKGIEAMKRGAANFLEKPADLDRLLELIAEATAKRTQLAEQRLEQKMKEVVGGKPW